MKNIKKVLMVAVAATALITVQNSYAMSLVNSPTKLKCESSKFLKNVERGFLRQLINKQYYSSFANNNASCANKWRAAIDAKKRKEQFVWKPLKTLESYSKGIYSLAFSPDGETLAAGLKNGIVKIWNKGDVIHIFKDHKDEVRILKFFPDGTSFLSSDERGANIRNIQENTSQILIDNEYIRKADTSPSGELLVSSGREGKKVWNKSGELIKILDNTDDDWGFSSDLTFSPNDQFVAYSSNRFTMEIKDARTGKVVTTIEDYDKENHNNSIMSHAWTPDSRFIASLWTDGTIKLWDVHTGQITQIIKNENYSADNKERKIVILPGGAQIATLGKKTLTLRDLKSGDVTQVLEDHVSGFIKPMAVSPDGTLIALGSMDCGLVRILAREKVEKKKPASLMERISRVFNRDI